MKHKSPGGQFGESAADVRYIAPLAEMDVPIFDDVGAPILAEMDVIFEEVAVDIVEMDVPIFEEVGAPILAEMDVIFEEVAVDIVEMDVPIFEEVDLVFEEVVVPIAEIVPSP